MKRLFFGFAILMTLQVNAQNYLIKFAGTGAASAVSEVKVENLTAGTTITINKGEILRLIGTAGLVSIDNKQYTIKIYPNPMTKDNTVLQIYPPDAGNALITVFDLTGKIEAQFLSYLGNYPQEFRLSGLKNGLHLINVTGKTYHFSSRLVCTGEAEGTISIEKISSYSPDDEKTSTAYSKRDETIVNMVYSTGDRLKFTGSSNIYSTVKVDMPLSDKTITFNFIPCIDGDNNSYPIVEIGSQIWMAENLKTTRYNDGSTIEYPGIKTNDWNNNTSGAYAWYDNDKVKYENTYGALYNWYAVNTDNLCPSGWHVPDSEDWMTLRDYLGGMNIAGGKIKETGNLHWAPTNKYSTNESGFTALPGGFRTIQSFTELKQFGYMWSSGSPLNSAGAPGWYINSVSEVLTESDTTFLNEGLSVRCILGESVISIPTVLTNKIINIFANTATCGGIIETYEEAHITALGVCWSISANPTIDNDKTSDISVDGTFTSNLSGLVPGTTYYVRAYATNRKGTAYGEELTFMALPVIPTLNTIPASLIKSTIAIAGGNISSNGGAVVTVSGICWDTSQNPSIAGSHTSDGTAIGSFASSMKDLIPSTLYYVRAYATNSQGTAYGNVISFTTGPLQIASLSTNTISSITSTTAISGGNIIDSGGKTITSRGICWATTSAPTTGDNKFANGAGIGSFTGSLSGLQPGTTYHVRAYAINSEGTAYGNDLTFTTNAVLSTITTKAVTGITRTTATSGGNITSNGGGSVTASGICWSTSHNPLVTGSLTTDGTQTGIFVSNMIGLIPNTLYYIRAYATNSAGTAYGNENSFTTNPVQIATLTTVVVSSVTSSTALSGGNVTNDGDGTITSRGICWAVTPAPTINDNLTSNGTGTGTFTSNVTGLLPVTTYHIRAYASNSAGTAYGNDITFTTLAAIPALTTTTASGITRTNVTSGGNITSNEGATVTTSGICWDTSHNPSIAGLHTVDGSAMGNFTSSLTGLIPNTLYFIRAYAINSVGTAYGNEVSFTTNPILIATLTTTGVSLITSTSASSGGNVTDDGGGTITDRGTCWATTSAPTISNSKSSNGTGTGSFTSSISGLQPGTTYHVRAYATNSEGTAYGNDLTFTTDAVIPSLTTTAVSGITRTTVISGGNITSNGGAAVTNSGICWNTSQNPSIAGSHSNDGSAVGNFTSNATGLIPNTLYYIRAYATNSAGTAYGNEVSFTTNPIVFATLTTATVSSITSTTATSGGNITDDGDGTITARGICWAVIPSPTISNNKTLNGTGKGTYTSNITGLLPVTTYYVRAYATNSAGTAYGNEISFTTNPIQIATLTTIAVSSITSATASSGGNITDDGGGTVNARGICWAVTPAPSISDNITLNGTGSGTFTSDLTGLQTVTTYYVRAYATNSAGTAYGNEVTFTTPAALPNLTTTAVSGITQTSATSGGNISSNGGAAVTTSGICWGTSHNPSIAGSHTADGTPIGNFASNMTGLIPGTLYYIRAYATNSAGTAYGNEVSFTTNPILLATLTTTSVSSITSTSASSGGNITDDGGGTITVRGTCWATTSSPTISNSKSTNGTGTGSYTSSISGLQPGTTYHIRAYATNSAGTAYGNDLIFTTDAIIPTITTTAVTSITRTTATSGGNIISDGGATVTTSGICWNTSHNPSIAGSHSQDGTATGNFASNATGLIPNTLYYIRAYATNSIGTAYGNEVSLTTSQITIATLTTTAISSIASTTASSGGNISDDGGVPVTARGICWANTSSPTIGNDKTADGTGTGSFSSSMTGLQPGTTYYVRAYASNSRGTAYGAQLSFTTDPLPNTDVTFSKSADGSLLLHSLGDKRIIFKNVGSNSYLKYSSDNGVTYNQGINVSGIFTSDNKARILGNGNIVLFCNSKIYYSNNNMATITPCVVLNKNGTVYTLHNPINAAFPGDYFNFMGGFVENDGVSVLGNYTNNSMGASPVNLYYSLDGITWKVFYTFGQNPHYTDNGTAMGGVGGTLLGDPGNPILARHIHSVNIGGDGNFYACTGDDDGEINFIKCSYNKISDVWSTNDLLTGASRTWQRMRALGVIERNGFLYWGSDGPGTFTFNGNQYDSFGIYKCAVSDINDPSKQILLQSLPDACYSFVNVNNIVFAGLQTYGAVYISYDYGETWSSYVKPAWMSGSVQGVWYNELYKYLVTVYGVFIESALF